MDNIKLQQINNFVKMFRPINLIQDKAKYRTLNPYATNGMLMSCDDLDTPTRNIVIPEDAFWDMLEILNMFSHEAQHNPNVRIAVDNLKIAYWMCR